MPRKAKVVEGTESSPQNTHEDTVTGATISSSSIASKIRTLFTESQYSQTSHHLNLQKLSNLTKKYLHKPTELEELTTIIQSCYDKILTFPSNQKDNLILVKHLMSFYISYLKQLILLASNSGSEESPLSSLFTQHMDYLLFRMQSLDKIVRFRCCQTFAYFFNNNSNSDEEDIEIECNLLEQIETQLVTRLSDKDLTVRKWAIYALKGFQKPDVPNDPILLEYIRLIECDVSKDIRSAVIDCLCLCSLSLPSLLSRLCDHQSEIRIQTLHKMITEEIDIRHLTSKQISFLVTHSLCDRQEEVSVVAFQLFAKWIHKLDWNIPKLFKLMNLKAYPREAEYVGWRILSELSSVPSASASASSSLSLSVSTLKTNMDALYSSHLISWNSISFIELSPSHLLWILCRCSFLSSASSSSSAAAAVPSYDLHDLYLPDIVILCRLIEEGIIALQVGYSGLGGEASQSIIINYELNMEYLLRILTHVDSHHDHVGSHELYQLCERVLLDTSSHTLELFIPLIMKLFFQLTEVLSLDYEMKIQHLLQMIQHVWSETETEGEGEGAEGGQGKEEEGEGDDEEEKEEKEILMKLKSLQILLEILQHEVSIAASVSSSTTTNSLSRYNSILPLLLSALSFPCSDLRFHSLKCLGLLCVASLEFSKKFLNLFVEIVNTSQEEEAIRCQAMEALCDLLRVHTSSRLTSSATSKGSGTSLCNDNGSGSSTSEELIIHLLKRSMQSISTQLANTTMVSCVKLLATEGCLCLMQSKEELFTQLVIQFFTKLHSSSASASASASSGPSSRGEGEGDEDGEDEEQEEDSEFAEEPHSALDNSHSNGSNSGGMGKKGSTEYANQFLTLFFDSYCAIGDPARVEMIYASLPLVVIEFCRLVKNDDINLSLVSLVKVSPPPSPSPSPSPSPLSSFLLLTPLPSPPLPFPSLSDLGSSLPMVGASAISPLLLLCYLLCVFSEEYHELQALCGHSQRDALSLLCLPSFSKETHDRAGEGLKALDSDSL
jgi:hypothetical protein